MLGPGSRLTFFQHHPEPVPKKQLLLLGGEYKLLQNQNVSLHYYHL